MAIYQKQNVQTHVFLVFTLLCLFSFDSCLSLITDEYEARFDGSDTRKFFFFLLLMPSVVLQLLNKYTFNQHTGCKIALVSATGVVLDTCIVYPHQPQKQRTETKTTLLGLIRKFSWCLKKKKHASFE